VRRRTFSRAACDNYIPLCDGQWPLRLSRLAPFSSLSLDVLNSLLATSVQPRMRLTEDAEQLQLE
jgi:hypothetical protein